MQGEHDRAEGPPAKTVLAIRHVQFENLGAFAPELARRGWTIGYRDAGIDAIEASAIDAADLLIVLGGPIGAYETHAYPFLSDEIAAIERRLASGRPMLGICLGAQLIARAAGARVYSTGTKEIGFAPIDLRGAGAASCLAPFAADPMTLHWHGDTFDLPAGADLLASTPATPNQAFALGKAVVAFQFHPEADTTTFERWLIGHAAELAAAGIAPARLRADARRHGPTLAVKARATIGRWLDALD